MAARLLRSKDEVAQELLKLAKFKDMRGSKKRCVVVGTKLVRDLGKRHHFKELLSLRGGDSALVEGLRAESRFVADERLLRKIAQLKSYDGLIGSLELPKPRVDFGDVRLMLCLEHVHDPGVLGTLLRTALALQWQAVFFLNGCADPFHPLVLRASQGALFDLPFGRGTHTQLQQLCRKRGLRFCVSHALGEDIGDPSFSPPPRGIALLLREEYRAPSAPPRDALKIRIPAPPSRENIPLPQSVAASRIDSIPPEADLSDAEVEAFDPRSLDVAVAGGILMHHLKSFHYQDVSRSVAMASPRAARGSPPR